MEENLVNELTNLSGTVESITYKNEGNGYTVAEVLIDNKPTTVVGIMPFLCEGDTAEFTGSFTTHSVYGDQFKVSSFTKTEPKTKVAILRYLSSGAVWGVGPATAAKIVEKFGTDTFDVIQNSPEMLSAIRGISHEKALKISEDYKKQFGVKDIIMLLSGYGISPERCVKIYQKLGKDSAVLLKENPYLLCEDGIDVSFEVVETIAEDFGILTESPARISSGILYILHKNLANGHTCLPKDKLLARAGELLGANDFLVSDCLDRLENALKVKVYNEDEKEFIALTEYYDAEEFVSARLLAVKNNITQSLPIENLEIENVENKLKIKFEDLQRKAIVDAFSNGILVLTGGPGTGKTTTLNAIIKLFEMRDLNIQLAAPTGRAAKRITELTGKDAKTIHRLLEVEWDESDNPVFSRNQFNPLPCDVIIIDEVSMVDSLLFASLLKALKLSCRIIIVGDSDQLPSIGAGNILNDILESNMFPSICLKKVFRQAAKSQIVTNAHAIINNTVAVFTNEDTDCFFLQRDNKNAVVDTVIELCSERLPNAYGIDPIKDIQLLCPSRKFDTGSINFNNLLQSFLNPKKKKGPQLSYKGIYFRIGDKVMQVKNNYDLTYIKDNGETGCGVYNGDVGYITDIDVKGGIIKVRYDDRIVTYFGESLSQIELAYAVTVHKSQGSEFDVVILPLFDVPQRLMYRNLLYTAVTRAKKLLVIVGSKATWNKMAENDRKTLRYTMLKGFIGKNGF